MALAALLPVAGTLWLGTSHLGGKNIVVLDRGRLDWRKPMHDRFGQESAGLYGMLPTFVQTLGGNLIRTGALTESALATADVLVLLHPDVPWTPSELETIRQYVGRGGSLLVVAGPWMYESGRQSTFNEVLAPLGLEVVADTAIPQADYWQASLAMAAHPATLGYQARFGAFELGRGSSIRVQWPGRPLAIGRWGWSDPGSDAVLTGEYRPEPGERLGDLVLAAERRWGRGRVAVLADPTALTNEGLCDAYPFAGRLLAYLASHADGPQALWRQGIVLVACVGVAVLTMRLGQAKSLATAALVLGALLPASLGLSTWSSRVVPDGRIASPNILPYIDASHLEAYSSQRWRFDGIGGLRLTLMRNGYLPLALYELSPERLGRAGMLLTVAPSRPCTAWERRAVVRFVEEGGLFVAMAGAEQAQAINPLLAEFRLGVPITPPLPGAPGGEPPALGFFRSAYLDEKGHRVDVLFYSGWPLACEPEPWERDLLEIVLWKPELVPQARRHIRPYHFVHEPYRRIFDTVCRLHSAGLLATVERLKAELAEPELRQLAAALHDAGRARGLLDPRQALQDAVAGTQRVQTEVLVRRFQDEPLVALRLVGKGKAVVVGDTGFALNKNLEIASGEPIDGRYENAYFWRWLVSYLTNQPEWFPPKPPPESAPLSSGPSPAGAPAGAAPEGSTPAASASEVQP